MNYSQVLELAKNTTSASPSYSPPDVTSDEQPGLVARRHLAHTLHDIPPSATEDFSTSEAPPSLFMTSVGQKGRDELLIYLIRSLSRAWQLQKQLTAIEEGYGLLAEGGESFDWRAELARERRHDDERLDRWLQE